jgi:hypothetical protein
MLIYTAETGEGALPLPSMNGTKTKSIPVSQPLEILQNFGLLFHYYDIGEDFLTIVSTAYQLIDIGLAIKTGGVSAVLKHLSLSAFARFLGEEVLWDLVQWIFFEARARELIEIKIARMISEFCLNFQYFPLIFSFLENHLLNLINQEYLSELDAEIDVSSISPTITSSGSLVVRNTGSKTADITAVVHFRLFSRDSQRLLVHAQDRIKILNVVPNQTQTVQFHQYGLKGLVNTHENNDDLYLQTEVVLYVGWKYVDYMGFCGDELMSGELELGKNASLSNISFNNESAIIYLFAPQGDFDLQVTDSSGNKAQANYSGDVLISEIPGSTLYNTAGGGEWIYISNTSYGPFTINVYHKSQNGSLPFNLTVFEFNPLDTATIRGYPPVIQLHLWEFPSEGLNLTAFIMATGNETFTGITVNASNLVSNDTTARLIPVIPTLTDLTVNPGNLTVLEFTFNATEPVDSGIFLGNITIGNSTINTSISIKITINASAYDLASPLIGEPYVNVSSIPTKGTILIRVEVNDVDSSVNEVFLMYRVGQDFSTLGEYFSLEMNLNTGRYQAVIHCNGSFEYLEFYIIARDNAFNSAQSDSFAMLRKSGPDNLILYILIIFSIIGAVSVIFWRYKKTRSLKKNKEN